MNTPHRARHLVLQYGWNSTAYQILNPGMRLWYSQSAPAVAGYVTRGRTMVIAGGPVCAAEALPAVTRELEAHARSRGERICYFHASNRLAEHFASSRQHSRIALGAQPVWNPADWPAVLKARPSLRGQLARARNKSVHVAIEPAEVVRKDPAFRRCLDEWLHSRPMPPMRFLVEPEAFRGELADRVLLVARQGDEPVGYLLASPIPRRHGFLAEQILRTRTAPNGTAELLIDALMTHLSAAGFSYLTLGLSPLCRESDAHLKANPIWLRGLTFVARVHGRRFYDFDGLEKFRAKLCPSHWEPVYAIANERPFSPRALYALLAAFSETPLPIFALQALAKSLTGTTRRIRGAKAAGRGEPFTSGQKLEAVV